MDPRALLGLLLTINTLIDNSFGNSLHQPGHKVKRRRGLSSPYDSGYVSDWPMSSVDWTMSGGRNIPPKCVDIPANMTLCRDIGYGQMRLPNLLDHDSLAEVTQQAASWVPLLNIQCHKNTKLFLCSLFSPVCLEREIYPCRQLCEAVKTGCEDRMKTYGYPWPEMLRCDKFPEQNDLCILPQEEDKENEICEPCRQPDTLHSLVDHYCQADFVLRMKISEHLVIDEDSALLPAKKIKKYKKGSLTKKELRSLRIFISGGAKCDCPQVNKAPKKARFIVMGRRVNDRLEASYIKLMDKKNKDQKKGLRKAHKGDVCKKGPGALTAEKQNPSKLDKTSSVTELPKDVSVKSEVSVSKTSKKDQDKRGKRGKKKGRGRDRKLRRRKNRRQDSDSRPN